MDIETPACLEPVMGPCSEEHMPSSPRSLSEDTGGDDTRAVNTVQSSSGRHYAESDAAFGPPASSASTISSPPRYSAEPSSDFVTIPSISYHVDSGVRFTPPPRLLSPEHVVDVPPAYTKD